MRNTAINYRDLVLIGGGHSHALVLRKWAMQPLPGVRLTLVSPNSLTPYSGMLPGLIAGNYSFEETHIDLARLCQFANARFIQAATTGIDLQTRSVQFAERPAIGCDVLSLNTGITPGLQIDGAANFGVPVKPIAEFYPRWQALVQALERDDTAGPFELAVVGGGAAGVELVFAVHHALASNSRITRNVRCHLVHQGERVPQNYPRAVQQRIGRALQAKGIQLHCNSQVSSALPNALHLAGGERLPVDAVFWCTPASAARWPEACGLATDTDGFVALNAFLQSTSHDWVFAAGDIAQQIATPRPRAGVFAVRQAPVLFENLQNYLTEQPLKAFRPQKSYLSLLTSGGRSAVGCRTAGLLPTVAGHWVWHWKRRIDQKFMAQFQQLTLPTGMQDEPVHPAISGELDPAKIEAAAMRCGGCGAKVGATILQRVMTQLHPVHQQGVVIGLQQPDDAAAIRVPDKQLLIQSVDVFRALLDDPWLLGKISAEHSLSDIFAMNARPHSALAIATLPYAAEDLIERDLLQLMCGAMEVLNEHQCELIGGHTSEGAELSLGFSVNGLADEAALLHKAGLQPGHRVILTKPLGTGALFAAHNQLLAKGPWLDEAIKWMLTSNKTAAQIFSAVGASACTDVTGFGLLGHLLEMLKPQRLQAVLELPQIPALPGVVALLQRGVTSSLHPDNMRLRRAICDLEHWPPHDNYQLLFDPQTSGGLLGCVPAERVNDCLEQLHAAGYTEATVIGEVWEQSFSNPDHPSVELIS
ncbi:selenide, water dikinase SelD [Pseudomaricurvus alcaniphilus]|uniref:selenide, water dikinase SelD n=1 Tax=Pseudomaricurvus alcaniphilus TaxID=1166482 RepID=UPI00140A8344|nr:selenide, water dikinase SelD [Pseudomaricurvus alcaniphilus]NHN36039.1 selenide, water dikinase SelD [Pseudomaricurvus alcaniphilus]